MRRIYVIYKTVSGTTKCVKGASSVINGHVFALDTIAGSSAKITFFDSYGRGLERLRQCDTLISDIKDYAIRERTHDVRMNRKRYQPTQSRICAHLCTYVLLMRSRGAQLPDIQRVLNNKKNIVVIVQTIERIKRRIGANRL